MGTDFCTQFIPGYIINSSSMQQHPSAEGRTGAATAPVVSSNGRRHKTDRHPARQTGLKPLSLSPGKKCLWIRTTLWMRLRPEAHTCLIWVLLVTAVLLIAHHAPQSPILAHRQHRDCLQKHKIPKGPSCCGFLGIQGVCAQALGHIPSFACADTLCTARKSGPK